MRASLVIISNNSYIFLVFLFSLNWKLYTLVLSLVPLNIKPLISIALSSQYRVVKTLNENNLDLFLKYLFSESFLGKPDSIGPCRIPENVP